MYLTLKSLHLIAVISWLAGLLYLPRLFVYHCGAIAGGELDQTLKIMERKLYRFIMTPAMVLSWALGLGLAFAYSGFPAWLHIKFALVVGLTLFHLWCGVTLRRFVAGTNEHSARFYKIINELPTLLLIGIVVMAVAKPFY